MRNPVSLYDILVAWQAGDLDYREAMEMARIDTLDELYVAAHNSGVTISAELTPAEDVMADRVAELLRGQPPRRAA